VELLPSKAFSFSSPEGLFEELADAVPPVVSEPLLTGVSALLMAAA